jgi:hypothetical protein
MDKNFALMCAAVLLFALVTLAWKDDAVSTRESESASARSETPLQQPRSAPTPMQVREVAPAAAPTDIDAEPPDAALLAHVEHKYRYLFADLSAAGLDLTEIRRHLLRREASALDLQTLRDGGNAAQTMLAQEAHVARLDAMIAALLPPGVSASYASLKDSDPEQHHLSEYTGGLSNVAPLSDQQERTVLEARLRHKQRYQTVLRDTGLDRDGLSPAEREYAHATAARALKQYRDDFLVDVSAALSQEQLTLLSSYETTEFTRELERLQRMINAK